MHFSYRIRLSLRSTVSAAAALMVAAFACGLAQAQNPFGGGDAGAANGGGQMITLSENQTPILNETSTDLIVRSVAQSNPTTPESLAKAIVVMVDLERFDEANRYLGSLAAIELDGAASYQLNDAIGPEFFYMAARLDELQPAGREFTKRVFAAAKEFANSPSRIDSLVQQLAQSNVMLRSEAFAKLRRIGSRAAATIIETFADESRRDEFAGLRGALYNFGDSATGPLLGAADSSNPVVQLEAIRGLAKQDSNEAIDVLTRAWLAADVAPAVKAVAENRLLQPGTNVDQSQIEARLADRIESFLAGRRTSSDSLLGEVTFWKWNADANSLESFTTSSDVAARVRAARLAETLYAIDPNSARHRELYLLTKLESAKRIVGPSKSIDVDSFLESTDALTAFEVERLLSRCIELDLIPAATGCCEVLKQIGDESQIVSGTRTPLINAMLAGDRHLQFAALDAIIKIDPKTAYAGSSYVGELAAYLASSRFKKEIVIGHIRNDLAQVYLTKLSTAGFAGDSAMTSRELFEIATSDPDVAIIFISDTLTQPTYQGLVQQLRSHWKTRRIPIGLLARDSDRLLTISRHTQHVDRLLTFPKTQNGVAINSQASQLEKLTSPWSVSSDDRYRHAAKSVAWLDRISRDRVYDFYNLRAHQDRLLGLLYHPEFTPAAARILASQPTRRAQNALVGFVSQNDLPLEARQAVADAFEAAVDRAGTMLTTNEIELQYDRYNASESQSAETQALLGRVLDVIETRRKVLRR